MSAPPDSAGAPRIKLHQPIYFFHTRTTKVIVRYEEKILKRLCYSLHLLFPIIVTSQVGGATKNKKRLSQNSNILLPSLSTPFPPSFGSPPSFVKKSRHPSSQLSLLKWPAVEPCLSPSPGTVESTGRSASSRK